MTDAPVYPPARAGRPLERAFDLAGALVGLTLGAPLLIATGLAVLWVHGRPVLHVQTRLGRRGRPFRLVKFRTLPREASARAATEWSVEAAHPLLRWLRQAGLDEAPQLWNVLAGQMSLVGPRPERPFFVDKLARELPHYRLRLELRPGITGLAQVRGLRGDTSIEQRLAADLEYLENRSLALNLRILGRTAAGLARSIRSAVWTRNPCPTRSTSSPS